MESTDLSEPSPKIDTKWGSEPAGPIDTEYESGTCARFVTGCDRHCGVWRDKADTRIRSQEAEEKQSL